MVRFPPGGLNENYHTIAESIEARIALAVGGNPYLL
jgi:hypothetical protein